MKKRSKILVITKLYFINKISTGRSRIVRMLGLSCSTQMKNNFVISVNISCQNGRKLQIHSMARSRLEDSIVIMEDNYAFRHTISTDSPNSTTSHQDPRANRICKTMEKKSWWLQT